MMERLLYAVLDPYGCVFRAGSALSLADAPSGAYRLLPPAPPGAGGAPAPGDPVLYLDRVRTIREIGRMMRFGDWLIDRPLSPQPVAGAGYVEIPPCPIGTVIEVSDMSGREVMAELEADADGWTGQIAFPDAGEYVVSVQAPPPYLEAKTGVII